MEFVKFNSKLFLFTDIFDLALIFQISTRPKIAKERNSLGNKLAFVGLISNIFVLLGRFGVLGPIRYFRADSVAVSVFAVRFGILTHPGHTVNPNDDLAVDWGWSWKSVWCMGPYRTKMAGNKIETE